MAERKCPGPELEAKQCGAALGPRAQRCQKCAQRDFYLGGRGAKVRRPRVAAEVSSPVNRWLTVKVEGLKEPRPRRLPPPHHSVDQLRASGYDAPPAPPRGAGRSGSPSSRLTVKVAGLTRTYHQRRCRQSAENLGVLRTAAVKALMDYLLAEMDHRAFYGSGTKEPVGLLGAAFPRKLKRKAGD